jgi:RNA polymerase sigma-70 factor (ECF subfamily)
MNAEEFKRRYYPFHPKLYRIAYALLNHAEDAEDILQDAYCKLWIKRADLAAILQPEAFCVTLVKNLCLDHLRSPGRRTDRDRNALPDAPDETTPISELESREQVGHIEAMIDRLPEKQRIVIRMRGCGDCSLEEIEQATGESAANVRTLLSRARKSLKMMLQKQDTHGKNGNRTTIG